MAQEKNSRTIALTAKTAEKLDMVKAGLFFKKGKKETNDTLIDYLLTQELEKIKNSKE